MCMCHSTIKGRTLSIWQFFSTAVESEKYIFHQLYGQFSILKINSFTRIYPQVIKMSISASIHGQKTCP